jgi:hypothetical protein
MKPASHLSGQRFGYLIVADRVWPNTKGNTRWRCRCDCGGETIVTAIQLKRGNTKSCGCLQRQRTSEAARTHGKSRTPVYGVWCGMMRRCYDEACVDYHRYGGRGIVVCERWHAFQNFYADMGDPPRGLTIERINNDGPYSPDNCKWATRAEQGANTSRVHRVQIDGVEMSLRAACEKLGLKPDTAYMRLHRGATLEEAIRCR